MAMRRAAARSINQSIKIYFLGSRNITAYYSMLAFRRLPEKHTLIKLVAYLTQPVAYTYVSVSRRNNEAGAMWARALHYSIDLWIQTYTEPVPLKYGKLATKLSAGIRIFLQCSSILCEIYCTCYLCPRSITCKFIYSLLLARMAENGMNVE